MSSRIIENIRKALENSKTNSLQNSASFFKTGPGEYAEHDQFIGVSVPQLRRIAKQFQTSDFQDFQELLQSPINEERLCALLMMILYYQKGNAQNKEKLYTFYCNNLLYVNNWNLVDSSAYQIMGDYLYNKDRSLLVTLAQSENLWQRRISIVATLFFIRKNDFSSTITIAKILLSDPHDLIHKAVGWMLREMGKRDKTVLIAFLKEHKKIMPKIMFRYAVERLSVDDINTICGLKEG
jgi:3-methyladenine DNA glycosylase AlkD